MQEPERPGDSRSPPTVTLTPGDRFPEYCNAARRGPVVTVTMMRTIGDLGLDLRYAARSLRAAPAFSLAVAFTLALGLGLNATVLGMMDALLLRPFQFRDYPRLVVLFESIKGSAERQPVAPANFLDWRHQLRTVERLVAWEGWGATLSGRDEPERLQGFRVTAGFFDVLGIPATAGRLFAGGDEEPGSDRRVIIGEGLWKRRFGADPGIVGTSILLDGEPHEIIGVAAPGFDFPVGAEVWAPLASGGARALDRGTRTLTVLGKLADGRTIDDARSELALVTRQLARHYPESNHDRGATIRSLSTAFREDTSGSFVGVLQAGAGLVLLIACANLAGLLLARANDRRREVAVRTALGASRARIVRQLVTEMVLLAIAASAIALVIARTGLEALRASLPPDMARYIEGWNNVRLDMRLVYVVPVLAVAIGILIGLVPALSASRGALTNALKDGDRGASGSLRRQRSRQTLVVLEIAFALALLVAAGLAMNGGLRMANAPGGFQADRLLTFNLPLPENRYREADARRTLSDAMVTRLEAIPGVERAALASVLPAAGWSRSAPLFIEDVPVADVARRPRAGIQSVSPGYFETMGVPVVSGRSFARSDREDSQPVAIISASLAARFWPDRDPVGKRLQVGDAPGSWLTIVGVAGDVTMYNWWDGIDRSAVYVPLRQDPPRGAVSGVIRTQAGPAGLMRPARAALGDVDPLLAVDSMRTMEQAIVQSTFGLRFMAYLMGISGGIALVLAMIGIYSMMAYAVSQRLHEFGVRMALGASARNVVRLSLEQAGLLTTLGILLGVAMALALGRLMSSALQGVIALDVTTFVQVSLGLAVVSLTAAWLPALRSGRLDPASVLRNR